MSARVNLLDPRALRPAGYGDSRSATGLPLSFRIIQAGGNWCASSQRSASANS
jgi:hypothetical protein